MLTQTYFPQARHLKTRRYHWLGVALVLGALAAFLVLSASASAPLAADVRMRGLIDDLGADRLTAQRHAAQRELEAAGESAVPALTVALRSDNWILRRNAADLLGYIASPTSAPALMQALNSDTVPDVRRNAAYSLGELEGTAAANGLQAAAVLDHSSTVRAAAEDALARIKSRLALAAGVNEQKVNAFAVATQNSNTVYLVAGRDLLVSRDGGQTWDNRAGALPSLATTLAISPADDQVVYAGVDSLGLFKSADGGHTWQALNQGLPVTAGARFVITALTIDPQDAQHIIAAAGVWLGSTRLEFHPLGLMHSRSGGLAWETLQAGTGDAPVTRLLVQNNKLYGIAQDRVMVYNWQ